MPFHLPSFPGLAADEAVTRLRPLLTQPRLEKIEKVLSQRCFGVSVVLENLYDRGNASAVMRTAEALGFGDLHSVEPTGKWKESQRTTAGADKWTELKRWKSTGEFVRFAKQEKIQLIVTALQADAVPIATIDFTKPSAFVLGNEKEGASEEIRAAADACVILPMVGFTQSYNISVAAALGLYHIYQDRLRRQGFHHDLTESQKMLLRAHYYLRTQDSGYDILGLR